MKLRSYQQAAIDGVFNWFVSGKEHPLIVMPTGTGKSLVLSGLAKSIIQDYDRARIIIATHSKELVAQNAEKFATIMPEIRMGIFSAGLGRKDYHRQVTFAGIQSIYKQGLRLPKIDILMIDEAHTLPHGSYGRWHKFIGDLKIANPHLQVIGLTATPFRLDSGHLCESEDRLFTGIAYEYGILEALRDGYLCEIVPKPVETRYDLSGVHTRGGEFKADELEAVINQDHLTRSSIQEIVHYGQDRGSWLIFSAGNNHAEAIHRILRDEHGLDGRVITQDTKTQDRDEWLRQFKIGELRYLVNNMILTTGFDAPCIDLIACLRPTKSAGLWVQICGRGMRLANGKEDCLMLDFGRNADRHGALDKIRTRKMKGDGDGDAPIKNCPNCNAVVPAAVRECPDCGFKFPPPETEISKQASTKALLSTQEKPEWLEVQDVRYSRNIGRDGKPDTLRVTYYTLINSIAEFICFEHPDHSYQFQKAIQWAKERDGFASSIDEALAINWKKPARIMAQKQGKYWDIKKYDFSCVAQ